MDKVLDDAIKIIISRSLEYERVLQDLPRLPADVEAVLAEIADAERACKDHFVLFESERDVDYDKQSEACRDHWSRCCRARDAAISKLVKLALLKHPAPLRPSNLL